MEDNWYYIKTWERMEEEFGAIINFTKQMEQDLPPTRCIYVKQDCWYGNNHQISWRISEDMIEAPAFKIGEKVLVRDYDDQEWEPVYFKGYVYNCKYPFAAKEELNKINLNFKYCKKYEGPKQPIVEITVKINNKECKLSEISEETLLKLRQAN